MVSEQLARWYDTIFSEKDYAGEVDAIRAIYREHTGIDGPDDVFDLGCGTGSHALEFERDGCEVWADDNDPAMLAVAKAKILRVGVPPDYVDMTVSLFHVTNYCLTIEKLAGLFTRAHIYLRPGGLFVFDTWDVLLARDDPPMPHRYKHIVGDLGGLRETLPIQYPDDDTVRVVNHTTIERRGDPQAEVFDWEYTHRLWTPAIIRDCLDMAGFSSSEPPRKWGKRSVIYVAVK